VAEVVLGAERADTLLGELIAAMPAGVHVVAVRQGRYNVLPEPQMRLNAGDVLLLFGEAAAIERVHQQIGRVEAAAWRAIAARLDIARFFVSRAGLAGCDDRRRRVS
jgi:uncharacterized protein with PhoU and TrkA domain